MRYTLLLFCICFTAAFANPINSIKEFPRKGKDYALFFAVNQYDKMRDLSNPIKDAKAIAVLLEQDYDFETEVVENPTLDVIEQTLKKYQKRFNQSAGGTYQSSGQLLIYFTGHGVLEYQNGYFLPKDGDTDRLSRTAFAYNIWRPFINSMDCKHILLAIDACYSGTFDPGWYSKSGFGRPGELSEGEKLLANHERYTARKFYTSATDVKTPDNSNFARKFQEGLQSKGGKDGILTSTELFTYLERSSPKPHHGDFGKWEAGSSFVFVLSDPLDGRSFTDVRTTNSLEKDLVAWRTAKEHNTIAAYSTYLEQFSAGEFRGLAIQKIEELEAVAANRREKLAWEIAKEKGDTEAYLSAYPNGKYAKDAKALKNTPPDDMIFIQGGTFTMGDQFGDGQDDEKPLHQVTINDYYLARTETTNQQFVNFLNDIRLSVDKDGELVHYRGNIIYDLVCSVCDNWEDRILYRNGNFELKVGYENHPVVLVTWYGAVSYCNWKSQQEGLQQVYSISEGKVSANWSANGYRLPTEAEWEYAARSRGKKYKYAWGNSTTPYGSLADETAKKTYSDWTIWEGYTDGYTDTAPVGKFEQGDLGLADMTGNVWEWCWDWHGDYSASSEKNPKGAATGSHRVLRGGSWSYYPTHCRVSNRFNFNPDLRDYYVGFRCARAR